MIYPPSFADTLRSLKPVLPRIFRSAIQDGLSLPFNESTPALESITLECNFRIESIWKEFVGNEKQIECQSQNTQELKKKVSFSRDGFEQQIRMAVINRLKEKAKNQSSPPDAEGSEEFEYLTQVLNSDNSLNKIHFFSKTYQESGLSPLGKLAPISHYDQAVIMKNLKEKLEKFPQLILQLLDALETQSCDSFCKELAHSLISSELELMKTSEDYANWFNQLVVEALDLVAGEVEKMSSIWTSSGQATSGKSNVILSPVSYHIEIDKGLVKRSISGVFASTAN